MGEMTIKGYAECEVECDLVKYIFNFEKIGYSIDASVKAVSAELERFLEIIEKKTGITPNTFRIENNSTSKKFNSEKGQRYEAQRKISVILPMSAKLSDLLMNIVAKHEFNVEINENYSISNIVEINQKLLKLAIENSKDKAEMIASFAGEKICGIKTLKILTRNLDSNYEDYEEGFMLDDIFKVLDSKSSQLSSPVTKLNQSVEITWSIE